MNTEDSQDKTVSMTTGQRLRQAREQQGMSQQAVAERLCLKLSTIREIENDNLSDHLAATFVRGYIRSYAKLLNLNGNELLPMLESQVPSAVAEVAQMQSFSLGKRRKKRDGWLMSFTWLILFVVVGLTGAWWWQNHKVQQEEIVTMAVQSSAQLSQHNEGQPVPVGSDAVDSGSPSVDTSVENGSIAEASQSSITANSQILPNPTANSMTALTPVEVSPLPTAPAEVITSDGLVINFSADCWFQAVDSKGKILFNGIKKNGDMLDLSGTAPYKLTIGVPAAVQVQYQGKPVDLSQFVNSNRVARLTVPAQ